MKIVVSGASGLIGSALVPALARAGHDVERLVRGAAAGKDEIAWDPARRTIDAARLEGRHAVVHLAGESIAGRWSERKKAAILASRVDGTRLLAETLARLGSPPRVVVCASAIGYYGDRGEELLDEASARGQGFLADVVERWEAAAEPARARGIRVANLRFGVVLSGKGGALKQMLPPFKLGVGGPVGDGRQYMSWIARDDVVGAIERAIASDGLAGPVNVVAPRAVTSREFARTLGKVLRRPAVLPLPAFAVKVAFGQMGEELLLASQRVAPRVLERAGFVHRYPELEAALARALGE